MTQSAKGESSTRAELEQTRRTAEAKLRALEASSAGRTRMSARHCWALLLTVVLLGIGWANTFKEMWYRWFPLWGREHVSFMEQFTEGDSYYTHGPLVPLASIILALIIYKKVGVPVGKHDGREIRGRTKLGRFVSYLGTHSGAQLLGWMTLIGFMLLHLMSCNAAVMFVSGFSLIGVLSGLLLLWGGWALFRAYWLPVALLLFMVPLPEVAIYDLNFRLKMLAADAAMWLTTNVFNVPAVKDGSYVYLADDPVTGAEKTLQVENVCSGLRSLISLTFFSAMFAMVCRVKGWWRVVLLIAAVPVAVASNIVRITGLNVVAHHDSVAAATKGGWFHDLSGLLVFAVALVILFGLEHLIILLNKLVKAKWVDQRLLGYVEDVKGTPGAKLRIARPALSLVLVGSTAWAVVMYTGQDSVDEGKMAAGSAPREIEAWGTRMVGTDGTLSELAIRILQTEDYLYRTYREVGQSGGKHFTLLIIYSANNRKGTHPPDVCLEGSGEAIVSKSIHTVDVPGMGPLEMRELITQDGDYWRYYTYIYKVGDGYTPSFFSQQFWVFMNGFIGRNTAGALVRFLVPMEGGDAASVQRAREQATEAIEATMPAIDRGLRGERVDQGESTAKVGAT